MAMRGDHVLIFLALVFGGSCLWGSFATLRRGKEAASFALIFSGLLFLLVAAFSLSITMSLPD